MKDYIADNFSTSFRFLVIYGFYMSIVFPIGLDNTITVFQAMFPIVFDINIIVFQIVFMQ